MAYRRCCSISSAGICRHETRQGIRIYGIAVSIFAVVVTYAMLMIDIRHAYHLGAPTLEGDMSQSEYYAYSIGTLLFGLGLLIGGVAFRHRGARAVSFFFVLAATIKVFLFDASELTGLWRVLSFLLMGLSFLGISWGYARFVFGIGLTKPPPAAPGQPAGDQAKRIDGTGPRAALLAGPTLRYVQMPAILSFLSDLVNPQFAWVHWPYALLVISMLMRRHGVAARHRDRRRRVAHHHPFDHSLRSGDRGLGVGAGPHQCRPAAPDLVGQTAYAFDTSTRRCWRATIMPGLSGRAARAADAAWRAGGAVEAGAVLLRGGPGGRPTCCSSTDGAARIEKGGVLIAVCSRGDFVGEMSFVSGNVATATVIADRPMRLASFDAATLKAKPRRRQGSAPRARGELQPQPDRQAEPGKWRGCGRRLSSQP